MDRHYDVLGVSPDADRREIRRAYRALSKEHHPDHGGSRERFLEIKRAYEAITGETAPDGTGASGGFGTIPDPTFDPEIRPERRDGGLSVSGDLLTLDLLGVAHDADLGTILGDRLEGSLTRTVAFFVAENVCDRRLRWRGRSNTSFIGDDGFMYEGSNVLAPHARTLAPTVCATDADLPPGRALRAIVVASEIPDDVTLESVVYTQRGPDGEGDVTERYLFELKPRVREALDRVPFDLE